jgi:hypothetical protein
MTPSLVLIEAILLKYSCIPPRVVCKLELGRTELGSFNTCMNAELSTLNSLLFLHFASTSSIPQAARMKFIISGTSLLACSTLTAANHHSSFAHTINKRQFPLPFGPLSAQFLDVGFISAAGVPLTFRRRDDTQLTNVSGIVYTVNLQLPLVGGPFGRSTYSQKMM